MTPKEFRAFCQLLDVTFRGDLTEPAEAAIARVFGRVSWDLAAATVDRLVLDGQVFVPVPGELVATLRRVVPDGTFGLGAALRGLTVAEYVEGTREPKRLGPGGRPAFDVLAAARGELEAGA